MEQLLGLKVLAVDDEPILLMALEDILQDLGCDVAASATTVAGAVAAVDTNDFQVAILDVTLGTEKIEGVVERLAGLHVPVIFATGLTPDEVQARFGDNSLAVEKPYSIHAIESALLSALGHCRPA